MGSRLRLRRRAIGAVTVAVTVTIFFASAGGPSAAKAPPAHRGPLHVHERDVRRLRLGRRPPARSATAGRRGYGTRQRPRTRRRRCPFSSRGPVPGGAADRPASRARRTTTRSAAVATTSFATAPTGGFRFDVEARRRRLRELVSTWAPPRAQIAGDQPGVRARRRRPHATGTTNGQAAVDRHFDDVMAWSRTAAYMPAWGNHEWDEPDRRPAQLQGPLRDPARADARRARPATGAAARTGAGSTPAACASSPIPSPTATRRWTDWRAGGPALGRRRRRTRRSASS